MALSKVAVCFSGLARGPIDWCSDTVGKQIIDELRSDVFMQAYNSEDLDRLVEIYKPKKMLVTAMHGQEYFMQKNSGRINSFQETKVANTVSMWENVYESIRLVDNSYTHVVRSRYDIGFVEGSGEIFEQLLDVKEKAIYIPEGGDNRGGIFDMFALGDYDSMKIYSQLYLI